MFTIGFGLYFSSRFSFVSLGIMFLRSGHVALYACNPLLLTLRSSLGTLHLALRPAFHHGLCSGKLNSTDSIYLLPFPFHLPVGFGLWKVPLRDHRVRSHVYLTCWAGEAVAAFLYQRPKATAQVQRPPCPRPFRHTGFAVPCQYLECCPRLAHDSSTELASAALLNQHPARFCRYSPRLFPLLAQRWTPASPPISSPPQMSLE